MHRVNSSYSSNPQLWKLFLLFSYSDCGCAVKRGGYFRSRRTAKRGFQNQLVERDREKAWRWGGCSVDIAHGLNFTKAFMDSREIRQNEKSLMNRHNNKAGHMVRAKHVTFSRKNEDTKILRTGRFDNIDLAVIISSVSKAVIISVVLPCLHC